MLGLGLGLNKSKKRGDLPPLPPVNISAPFLVGSGIVGEPITCNKGTWSGRPAPTYTYDFRVNGVSVQNSASNIYVPQPSDDGLAVTCDVTATNASGSATASTSNNIVVGTAPVNTVAPTVTPSGTQSTDAVITVNVGTWSGTPTILYAYRWTRNGSPISGATSSTYTIQAADDGTTIRCEVRGTNAYGVSSYVASSTFVSAVNAIAPVNISAPTISGSTTLGSTLTTTDGTWTGIPTPTYSYQWKRNGSNIGGAINSTYVTTLADSSANITCDVTATNTAGSATAGSNTITLPSYAPVNTFAPAVTGTAVVGQTLSTTNGTWTNSPASFAYQWFRGATPIGTNSANYTLVQADAGNASNITCRVTATNSAGSANATSNTIVQVFDANADSAISVGAITGSRQRDALNQLAINLKGVGQTSTASPIDVWTELKFMYPYCPINDSTANATSFAVNLRNTSRNLTFVGFVAGDFTVNGLTGGAGKYALTGYTPSADFSLNSAGLDCYSRTQSQNINCAMGASDASYANGLYIYIRDTGNLGYSRANDNSDLTPTITDSRGLFSIGRTASNAKNYRRNAVVQATATTASSALSTREIILHGLNRGGTIAEFDSRQFSGFSGRNGMNQTQMDYLYECIQIFNTNVVSGGRQV